FRFSLCKPMATNWMGPKIWSRVSVGIGVAPVVRVAPCNARGTHVAPRMSRVLAALAVLRYVAMRRVHIRKTQSHAAGECRHRFHRQATTERSQLSCRPSSRYL